MEILLFEEFKKKNSFEDKKKLKKIDLSKEAEENRVFQKYLDDMFDGDIDAYIDFMNKKKK